MTQKNHFLSYATSLSLGFKYSQNKAFLVLLASLPFFINATLIP